MATIEPLTNMLEPYTRNVQAWLETVKRVNTQDLFHLAESANVDLSHSLHLSLKLDWETELINNVLDGEENTYLNRHGLLLNSYNYDSIESTNLSFECNLHELQGCITKAHPSSLVAYNQLAFGLNHKFIELSKREMRHQNLHLFTQLSPEFEFFCLRHNEERDQLLALNLREQRVYIELKEEWLDSHQQLEIALRDLNEKLLINAIIEKSYLQQFGEIDFKIKQLELSCLLAQTMVNLANENPQLSLTTLEQRAHSILSEEFTENKDNTVRPETSLITVVRNKAGIVI